MKRILILIFIFAILFSRCSVTRTGVGEKRATVNSLKYLGEYEVPFNQQFKGTTIGGLSGIDYDANKGLYYLICDDRSSINPARFYTAKINFTAKGITNLDFAGVTTLLQSDGSSYPNKQKDPAHVPDPEAMRYNAITDQFIWASEGERIVGKETILQDPAITIISKEGKYIDTFPLPFQTRMYATEKGLRQNSVFEGLAFANNFKTMYVSIEEPLYEDGPRAGLQKSNAITRIIKYDMANRKPVAQYAYPLETVANAPTPINEFMVNGITDILSIGDNKLLVIERSYSTGIKASTIRVYVTDLSKSSNILNTSSLIQQPAPHAALKKLLINMDSLGMYIDNIEGVTFGADLPNGHKTLIFVSDNNFSKEQRTQLLLFEVIN
jgi:hypothetical protein